MEYDSIMKLIAQSPDVFQFGDFGNGVSDEWISKAESRLNVKLPPSYIWWLKNYGGGEINGEEIFSIYEMDFDTVVGGDLVYANEINRKNGLTSPNELAIQENDQGEIYYFKLDEVNQEGEYPVYLDISRTKYAGNFLEFLKKKGRE